MSDHPLITDEAVDKAIDAVLEAMDEASESPMHKGPDVGAEPYTRRSLQAFIAHHEGENDRLVKLSEVVEWLRKQSAWTSPETAAVCIERKFLK